MISTSVISKKKRYDFKNINELLANENEIIIRNKNVTNVGIAESIVNGKIIMENCNIIDDVMLEKLNGLSIIFKKCTFYHEVTLKNIEAEILFQGCDMYKKVYIHYDEKYYGTKLEFIYTSIPESLIVDGFKGDLFKILRCNINKVELGQYLDLKNLDIQESEFNTFRFNLPSIESVRIISCFFYQFFDLNMEQCGLLYIHNTEIKALKISDAIKNSIERRKIPSLFFTEEEDEAIKWGRIADTLLVLHSTFEKDRYYDYSDKTFQLLRKARVRETFYSKRESVFSKTKVLLASFFIGTLFGWGVNIRNSLYTTLGTIFMYAFIYFGTLEEIRQENVATIFMESLQISTERFFSLRDTAYELQLLPFFETQESLVGLIIITITTAMIVRKIIR